ncbi:hypothetical protein CDAR_65721 [Caerostris darwini]|uniref:Uncharacterized protein n=1 Tax=Caerostris darwini TaxID=1538125 RepID=A0AAV4UCK8_9ARAC|nr:hypothetical protein CDAR_65721 [Caerostris darwini]
MRPPLLPPLHRRCLNDHRTIPSFRVVVERTCLATTLKKGAHDVTAAEGALLSAEKVVGVNAADGRAIEKGRAPLFLACVIVTRHKGPRLDGRCMALAGPLRNSSRKASECSGLRKKWRKTSELVQTMFVECSTALDPKE